MSQCVPSWDLDEGPAPAPERLSARSHSNSTPPDVPILDYEVAELTWENGQLAMHGLGQPRVSLKPHHNQLPAAATYTTSLSNKYSTWDKLPRGTGTLESIVNQAAAASVLPHRKPQASPAFDDIVPWFDRPDVAAAAAAKPSATVTMDALVPCTTAADPHQRKHHDQAVAVRLLNEPPAVPSTCLVGCSTRAGSCSGPAPVLHEEVARKRARVAAAVRVPAAEWSGRDQYSVSGSATAGRETGGREMYVTGTYASTSMGSQDNTSSGARPNNRAAAATTTADDHDSVCHSLSQREECEEEDNVKRNGKSSVSTKRSRAAAIHNQSERKRRDKINQRMKTLQKLVPNSSKTDKASVLDEAIEYLKQLQAQVQMMNRMNMQPMMMPMALPQQLQMSMMAAAAPMGLGMGMGMGMAGVMDVNALTRANLPGMPTAAPTPILHPAAAANPFFPLAPSWDGSSCNAAGDRLHAASAAVLTDPLSAFLACQSQPMTLDTYSRMAAIYQQMHQPPASSSKN